MSFEKEKIIEELKKQEEEVSISKLYNLVKPMPYYRIKLEFIPELEKEGLITVSNIGAFTYIKLNEK